MSAPGHIQNYAGNPQNIPLLPKEDPGCLCWRTRSPISVFRRSAATAMLITLFTELGFVIYYQSFPVATPKECVNKVAPPIITFSALTLATSLPGLAMAIFYQTSNHWPCHAKNKQECHSKAALVLTSGATIFSIFSIWLVYSSCFKS